MKIRLQYAHVNPGYTSGIIPIILALINPIQWRHWRRNITSSGKSKISYKAKYRRLNIWPFSFWV